MSTFAILGSNNGGQCLSESCGHDNGFIAKLAATFMDPNFEYSFAQAHAITKIAHQLGGQVPAHFEAGEQVSAAGTGKASGGMELR